ncbi:MAG TPA: hypothetical protein VNA30_05635 [Mycobacteriales bacterium]|nr:hypothetical protein [Mycobacteriales bacterium]
MRNSLVRPVAVLALVAAGLLAAPASAAPSAPLVLTDQPGDGNSLNDQGLGQGPEGTAGPGSQPGLDIKSLTFANYGVTTTKTTVNKKTKKKVTTSTFDCQGYTATLELSGPPTDHTVYRIMGKGAVNTVSFWVNFDINAAFGTTTSIRYSSGTAKTHDLSIPAKVEGNKVTYTVSLKDLKATGEKGAGTVLSALGMQVRTSTAVTAPVWDQIRATDKDFVVC